jgi:hypothetical protein
MKRVLVAFLCLLIPAILFLNAWQGYRFDALANTVADLEKQQKDLLESNRDVTGKIAYETSPERVAEKAASLGLAAPSAAAVTRLQVNGAGGTTP